MVIARKILSFGAALAVACAVSAPAVLAAPLRVPQVPLQTGWDGYSLQSYLNGRSQTITTLTDQLDVQTWLAPPSGGTTFTLMIEVAGYAPRNNVGIYNASEVNPAKYLVLPGAASAGWTASCQFGASGQLVVRLFDQNHVLQGITNYAGVDRNNFGFYLEGPAGTFWSQDARNPGGKPQALTFAATGAYAGQHWQCFEDLPYASSDIDYQDAILLLYQTQPTAVSGATWSRLKELYR